MATSTKNVKKTTATKTQTKQTITKTTPVVETIEKVVETKAEPVVAKTEPKKFMPGDMILCRCVRPNLVVFYSTKTDTRYEFGGYGDTNEVDFADLQRLKSSKSPILYQPKILIEDEELRKQWAKDLESVRHEYEGIYETEDIFDKPYDEFKHFVSNASKGIKELIRTSAVKLINEKKLTDLSKIMVIDDLLGTKLKEFL